MINKFSLLKHFHSFYWQLVLSLDLRINIINKWVLFLILYLIIISNYWKDHEMHSNLIDWRIELKIFYSCDRKNKWILSDVK